MFLLLMPLRGCSDCFSVHSTCLVQYLFSCALMVLQGFCHAVYVSIIVSAYGEFPKVLELAFSLSLFVKTWIQLYFHYFYITERGLARFKNKSCK